MGDSANTQTHQSLSLGAKEAPVKQNQAEAVPSENETILKTLKQIVDPLVEAFPGQVEVLVHDLDRLPNSIVAISGELTGRSVGDPATDMLLEGASRGELETKTGYKTISPAGLQLNSATFIVRDSKGNPSAALCINANAEPWIVLQNLIAQAAPSVHRPTTGSEESPEVQESFSKNIEQLAKSIVERAVKAQGVPVALMQKEHKLRVVKAAQDGGLFKLRGAPEMMAEALDVTRYTVYNYLAELTECAE